MYKSITFFTVTHAQTHERSTGRPITSSVRDEKKKCPLHTHNCGKFLVNSRTRFLPHAGRGRRSTQESVTSSKRSKTADALRRTSTR